MTDELLVKMMRSFAGVLEHYADQIEEVTRRAQPPSKAALDLSIESLELSVRASNVLDRLGLKTVGDLVSRASVSRLRVTRGVGPRTLREIQDVLANLNVEMTK